MMTGTYTIRSASGAGDIETARELFRAYADELDFELDFQNFEEELDRLPRPYVLPKGDLLFAEMSDGTVAGCVGLRPLEGDICEMKRLYVRPQYRRQGIGRALTRTILDRGRALGYDRMRLDTVADMHAARSIYTSLGFYEIDPYRHNPLDGAVYMEAEL